MKTPEELKHYEDKIERVRSDQTLTDAERTKWVEVWQYRMRYDRPKSDYEKYCFDCPSPIPEGWLAEQYETGRLIPVHRLVTCAFYEGSCRNASVAVWDGILKRFTYVRSKWGSTFLEDINSVEQDDGHDLFLPHYEIKDPTDERVAGLKELLSKRGNREP